MLDPHYLEEPADVKALVTALRQCRDIGAGNAMKDWRAREVAPGPDARTDAELAEIKRRRPGVRASLAISGMVLTAEEEALFEQMDVERLTADQRTQRIIEVCRARSGAKTPV